MQPDCHAAVTALIELSKWKCTHTHTNTDIGKPTHSWAIFRVLVHHLAAMPMHVFGLGDPFL